MQTETAKQNNSILARLKAETAHQHQQTEDTVDLLSDNFSLEDYKNLLVKFYAFYDSFEAKMKQAIEDTQVDFNYKERLNTPKLQVDLEALGMSDAEILPISLFYDLPALDSKEKVFGALYVVEGSTLGGQVISRHLKEKFDLNETKGASFFSGYGKDTGKMWNAFREKIMAFAEGEVDEEEIIESAKETFEKIGKALSSP